MMPSTLRLRLFAGIAILISLPSPVTFAMTREEALCRATIARGVAKQLRLATRDITRCHKQRDAGIRPAATDCNDLDIAVVGGVLAAAEQSLRDRLGSGSGPCAASPSVLAAFPGCKSPVETADDGGATNGTDDFSELASCRIATTRALVEATARQVLGSPDVAGLTPGAIGCHTTLANVSARVLGMIVRERVTCQTALDSAGGPLDYGCEGEDPDGRTAAALQKLADQIEARCGDLGLDEADAMDSCGDTAAQLRDCVGTRIVEPIGSGLASSPYTSGVCPRGLVVEVLGGRASGKTETSVDWGENGLAHSQDIADGSAFALSLDCDPETCGSCEVTLDPREDEPDGSCRCRSDSSLSCSTVNGNDPACGGGLCDCFVFPPQPIGASGFPICLVQTLEAPVSGTVDPAKGSVSIGLDTRARIHLGESVVDPCPRCEGDAVVGDGLRDGTCDGGSRAGLACDTNAMHGTYGAMAHDCPPNPAMAIGNGAVVQMAPLTDGSGVSPPSVCAVGDSCVGGCTVDAAGGDWTCDDDGPTDSFCDGVLTASGDGVVPCAVQEDCEHFDAGDCSLLQRRSCLPDPLVVEGSAASGRLLGVFRSRLVAASPSCFDVAPPLNDGGYVRFRYDVTLDPKCGVCEAAPSECCQVDADCGVGDRCVPGGTSWSPSTGSTCGC